MSNDNAAPKILPNRKQRRGYKKLTGLAYPAQMKPFVGIVQKDQQPLDPSSTKRRVRAHMEKMKYAKKAGE